MIKIIRDSVLHFPTLLPPTFCFLIPDFKTEYFHFRLFINSELIWFKNQQKVTRVRGGGSGQRRSKKCYALFGHPLIGFWIAHENLLLHTKIILCTLTMWFTRTVFENSCLHASCECLSQNQPKQEKWHNPRKTHRTHSGKSVHSRTDMAKQQNTSLWRIISTAPKHGFSIKPKE